MVSSAELFDQRVLEKLLAKKTAIVLVLQDFDLQGDGNIAQEEFELALQMLGQHPPPPPLPVCCAAALTFQVLPSEMRKAASRLTALAALGLAGLTAAPRRSMRWSAAATPPPPAAAHRPVTRPRDAVITVLRLCIRSFDSWRTHGRTVGLSGPSMVTTAAHAAILDYHQIERP